MSKSIGRLIALTVIFSSAESSEIGGWWVGGGVRMETESSSSGDRSSGGRLGNDLKELLGTAELNRLIASCSARGSSVSFSLAKQNCHTRV